MYLNRYLLSDPKINKRNGWYRKIPFFKGRWYKEMLSWLRGMGPDIHIVPSPDRIFEAFDLCPWDKTRVVIIDTEPSRNARTARGIALKPGPRANRSTLGALLHVLVEEVPGIKHRGYDIAKWCDNGIFLGHCMYTTEHKGIASGMHKSLHWYILNWQIARAVTYEKEKCVIILVGSLAKLLARFYDNPNHLVITIPTGSPTNRDYLNLLRSKRIFVRSAKYLEVDPLTLWRLV